MYRKSRASPSRNSTKTCYGSLVTFHWGLSDYATSGYGKHVTPAKFSWLSQEPSTPQTFEIPQSRYGVHLTQLLPLAQAKTALPTQRAGSAYATANPPMNGTYNAYTEIFNFVAAINLITKLQPLFHQTKDSQ